jgi:hypothetical protein
MKSRLLTFLLLFTVFFLSARAQTNVLHKLDWKEDTGNESCGLMFDGCSYNNSGFPVFYQQIPLESNVTISKVLITEAVYIPLDSISKTNLQLSIELNDDATLQIEYLTASKKRFAQLSILPFRMNPQNGKVECLVSFNLDYEYDYPSENYKTDNQNRSYVSHSVLASGTWARVAVYQAGIQKITYGELASMGLPIPILADKIRVFGNGGKILPENTNDARPDDLKEISIYVEENGDGMINEADDYILFYGESVNTWTYNTISHAYAHQGNYYNDYSCYFINISDSAGKRVESISSDTATADVNVDQFQDYAFHELDSVNLLLSGKNWYGEVFNSQLVQTIHFNFPNISDTNYATLKVTLAARSYDTSYFHITACGETTDMTFAAVDENVNADYVRSAIVRDTILPLSSNMDVKIEYEKRIENSSGFLDYIEWNVTRSLIFTGGQMSFRNSETLNAGMANFQIKEVNAGNRLWDVNDPAHVKEISLSIVGSDASFKRETDSLHEYVLFDGTQFFVPVFLDLVQNQDLHFTSFPDMIIVTHPDFLEQADRLAEFHRENDGLDVMVVEPQIIYNEFSSGMQDPTAIRDFIRMLYVRAGGDSLLFPQYVLLFGDGSYDMKNRINPNTNFIPTYQTLNSTTPTGSFVSDDYFGLLDDNEGPNAMGLVDAGVGRLPVTTVDEANVVVDKILRYSSNVDLLPPSSNPSPDQISNFDSWRNEIAFIADDEDGNMHFKQAETLVKIKDSLNKELNVNKIYLDAFQQVHTSNGNSYPAAHDKINSQVEKGALIINYTGHGGVTGLSEEGVVKISDIDKWKNYYNLIVLITATCEFSRYDNPAEVSAGEHVLLNDVGGGAALFSTVRVAYAYSNMIINSNILIAAFEPGSTCRLGDIIRIGKVRSGTGVYIQNFTLLGDPAMKLAIPQYKVYTTGLQGDSLEPGSDTIYAGQKILINGFITDANGNILPDFNGEIYPVVFDKPAIKYTLRNDIQSNVAPFSTQEDILFKGRSSVTNGLFSFTFTLPKDVSFRTGNAKFSYYAKSMNNDAAGYYNDFALVNNGIQTAGDGKGPDIDLFINDRSFISNGITGNDPKLIADLKDDDGINFFGVGMGHDILMVLDDDFANPCILNDFYEPAMDSSGKGTIYYSFSDLSEGPHKLWLKCWDVLNFSSEAEISFIVRENHDISLNHVEVFPNPMLNEVQFCFDRNKTTGKEWVEIIIHSVDGKTIQTLEQELSGSPEISTCIKWDGSMQNGENAPTGLYLYTLKITDDTGNHIQYSGKIAKVE